MLKDFRRSRLFINREVPRNMMIFIIKSFGGEVCWDGEGSPFDADDARITHVVIDRPTKNMKLNPKVVYVQPQWVCDCANWRVLIPPGSTRRIASRRRT